VTPPPAQPKLYHITHIDNLPAIVRDGCLVSDATMILRGGPAQSIGMSDIKRRRIEELDVSCHPGAKVGDYVPSYFCPRSVMLYVICRGNHPSLTYHGGQGPIVHLVADLHAVVRWAEEHRGRWCFSLSNAGAYYAEFRSRLDELDQLDWHAIEAQDFRAASVKEGKQAEFLLHGQLPFALVERIGVHSELMRARVIGALGGSSYRPVIEVRPEWYF
jgi:hypothetical protein